MRTYPEQYISRDEQAIIMQQVAIYNEWWQYEEEMKQREEEILSLNSELQPAPVAVGFDGMIIDGAEGINDTFIVTPFNYKTE